MKKDTLLHYDHIGLLKPQWVGRMAIATIPARQIPTYDLIATLRPSGDPSGGDPVVPDRRSPEALMDLLREKEADWEAERRRLARMGAFLHKRQDKWRWPRPSGRGRFGWRPFRRPTVRWWRLDFAHAKFEEAVYLLHVRQLITWARENGSPSQAPGDIICRESLERGDFMEDYYYCLVPPGTTGWPLRVRPAGTYAVLYHQGSYASEYGACRRLRDWVLAQGYAIDGDLYEEDLVNDIASEDPRSYLLKLSLKIQTP